MHTLIWFIIVSLWRREFMLLAFSHSRVAISISCSYMHTSFSKAKIRFWDFPINEECCIEILKAVYYELLMLSRGEVQIKWQIHSGNCLKLATAGHDSHARKLNVKTVILLHLKLYNHSCGIHSFHMRGKFLSFNGIFLWAIQTPWFVQCMFTLEYLDRKISSVVVEEVLILEWRGLKFLRVNFLK